jgi:hypothetical protein
VLVFAIEPIAQREHRLMARRQLLEQTPDMLPGLAEVDRTHRIDGLLILHFDRAVAILLGVAVERDRLLKAARALPLLEREDAQPIHRRFDVHSGCFQRPAALEKPIDRPHLLMHVDRDADEILPVADGAS